MQKPVVIRKADLNFRPWSDGPGKAEIAQTVTSEKCRTIGGGIGRFDGCSVAWKLRYDEIVFCVEGQFRLRVGSEVFILDPGDSLLIPEDTDVRYEGTGATVFYALSPNDWMQRHGLKNPLDSDV